MQNFERLAHIQGVVTAGLINPQGDLLASVSNTPMSHEKIRFIGETCFNVMEALSLRRLPAQEGVARLGEYALVWREWQGNVLFLLLESKVNDAVLRWLWDSVLSLLQPR